MSIIKSASIPAAILALIVGWPVTAVSAPPKDWSKVPVNNVKLFYPGQSSYQWLRSPAHKRAYKKTIAGVSGAGPNRQNGIDLDQGVG